MHHSTQPVGRPSALSCGKYAAKPRIGRTAENCSPRRAEELPQAAFQTSACPGDDCSGLRANHIATGENTVVRPLPNFGQIEGSAPSVADPPGQSRRRRDFPPLEVASLLYRNDQRCTDRAHAWFQHRAQICAREAAYHRITARQQAAARERSRNRDQGYGLEL